MSTTYTIEVPDLKDVDMDTRVKGFEALLLRYWALALPDGTVEVSYERDFLDHTTDAYITCIKNRSCLLIATPLKQDYWISQYTISCIASMISKFSRTRI